MSTARPKLSDFVVRPARIDDYNGVMAISEGIYGGRDILPSVYVDYLKDPNRIFYVATLNGKVASFGGARICDNVETYEGEAARTDPKYHGTGLFIFAKLRNILLRDGALPRWPNLQRVRIVTVNVESTLKLPGFHFRMGARRVVRQLTWDNLRHAFLKQLSKLNRGLWDTRLPLSRIQRASGNDLYQIFTSCYSQELFPESILIRDSQAFTVGKQYLSNIPLLLGDRLHAMFLTREISDLRSKVTSISFGVGIESNVDRQRMRYCIDYYGVPDCDVIKAHIFKHHQEIRGCLERSRLATMVISHIFMPKIVHDVIDGDVLVTFVTQELGFGNIPDDDAVSGVTHQIIADTIQTPREYLAELKGKL